jgi:uncharacterized protein HemX
MSSLDELKETFAPTHRAAIVVIVALVVGSAIVVVGLVKLDDRIEKVSRAARAEDEKAASVANAVGVEHAKAIDAEQDRRLTALEAEAKEQSAKLDKVLDKVGDVATDVRVIRARFSEK